VFDSCFCSIRLLLFFSFLLVSLLQHYRFHYLVVICLLSFVLLSLVVVTSFCIYIFRISHVLVLLFVHILPNTMPVLMSSVMIGFNNAVLAEAGMSYLGIGVQPPSASLGSMLSESQTYLFSAPWYALFPGLMIILMVLGLSFLADRRGK